MVNKEDELCIIYIDYLMSADAMRFRQQSFRHEILPKVFPGRLRNPPPCRSPLEGGSFRFTGLKTRFMYGRIITINRDLWR